MNSLRFSLLLAGWHHHPWLRLLACAAFALGFGLALLAVQLWHTGSVFLDTRLGQRPAGDSILLSRPGSGPIGFTRQDIERIAARPEVLRTWPVTSNRFRSRTVIQLGTARFSTELFFDAVPDAFLAPRPEQWSWEPGKGPLPELPIMIPQDFLELYNYGFAPARSLPPLGSDALGLVPLEIIIEGPGRAVRLTGRIVGVTNQLSSILVPESFMLWANARFPAEALPHGAGAIAANRLVATLKNAADPAFARWALSEGWLVQGRQSGLREAFGLIMVLVSVFGGLGFLVLALALGLLCLDRANQLARDGRELRSLVLLGHHPARLAWLGMAPDSLILAALCLSAWLACLVASGGLAQALVGFGLSEAGRLPPGSALTAVLLCLAVSAIHHGQLRRALKRF